jgi:hypothetical protein
MNSFSGKAPRSPWALLKTERQDWRVYAAYLRVLLIIAAVLLVIFIAGSYVMSLLGSSQSAKAWILPLSSGVAAYWVIARMGFLVAPVIAAGEGSVLRAGWTLSGKSALRNCVLIALLGAPGVFVWFCGEFLFRVDSPIPYAGAGSSLAEYANAMAQTLGEFVALASASAFVSIILLTVGALHVYGQESRRN